MIYFFFFFFSSRRRHTRLQGDWSSDVCSSDLRAHSRRGLVQQLVDRRVHRMLPASWKIGRESCRERGEISVVAVSLKKKRVGQEYARWTGAGVPPARDGQGARGWA